MDDVERRRRFERLFFDHSAAVRAYALRRVRPSLADDVVSEVFAVAWRRLDRVPEANALPWLFGCARRLIANHRRADRRREALIERLHYERVAQSGPEFAVESPLRDALWSLSERDREVLMLVAWEGLEPARAAVVLNCSQRAFVMRLHRARRRLAIAMQAADGARPDPMEALT